jgi:hypothetical protein
VALFALGKRKANSSIHGVLAWLGATALWPDWKPRFELGQRNPTLALAIEQPESR